jgi:hypothetical protein
MVHRQHPSRMRRKYRAINMCGNLCHLPLSVRHTEARAKVLQKNRERKERQQQQRGISMLPFHNQQAFGTKGEYAFDRYQFPVPGLRPLHGLSGAASAAKQSNNSSAPSRTNFICATASSSSLAASPSGAPATRHLWPATRPPHSDLR